MTAAAVALAIILAAALKMGTMPAVCVPVALDDRGQEIIACLPKAE